MCQQPAKKNGRWKKVPDFLKCHFLSKTCLFFCLSHFSECAGFFLLKIVFFFKDVPAFFLLIKKCKKCTRLIKNLLLFEKCSGFSQICFLFNLFFLNSEIKRKRLLPYMPAAKLHTREGHSLIFFCTRR